jgi:exopolysaccharide biosynthesis polyprenyl glycosylphosphotransferase
MLFSERSKIYTRRSILLRLFQSWDVFLLLICFALAAFINNPKLSQNEVFLLLFENPFFLIVSVLIWSFLGSYSNLYTSKRLTTRLDLLEITKTVSVGVAFITVAAEIFKTDFNTSEFIMVFWALFLLGLIITRLVLYRVLEYSRIRNHNLRNIIIVGIGDRGQSIAELLKEHPEIGYRVIGYIDEIKKINQHDFKDENVELLGGLDDFPQIISEISVDEVFICLPIKSSYDEIDKIVNQCKEQGIPARLSGNFFNLEEIKIKVGYLGDGPIITLYNGMEESPELTVKRLFDLTISAILLVLLLPLFVLVAALVKSTSQGPVFFVQKRIGLHKKEFMLYKFRTMVTDAEIKQQKLESKNEAGGPVFKIANDPRITGIGSFLRRYSIDELPQLFNVFKGEMSLVGPRPLPVRDFNKFNENWTRRRFSVRPGITCIWQTSGRSNLSFEQWMELDLKYIDNWSLRLDFLILLKTLPTIIKGTGAY